jgi:hypothetical protein
MLCQVVSPEGKTYYYHTRTRKSQWERPNAATVVEEEERVPMSREKEKEEVVAKEKEVVIDKPVYIYEEAPALSKKEEVNSYLHCCLLSPVFFVLIFSTIRKRNGSAMRRNGWPTMSARPPWTR